MVDIVLREHESVRLRLSPEEAAQLRSSKLRLKVLPQGGDQYDVGASHFVGSDSYARVVPKLPVSRLFYVLSGSPEALDPTDWDTQEESEDTERVLLELYSRSLDRALTRGLIRSYERESEVLGHVRGRLDWVDLAVRRFGVFPPLLCEFDEYTEDVEPNRRLLAAAHLLARGRFAQSAAARRLDALAFSLRSRVALDISGQRLDPIDVGHLSWAQLGEGAKTYSAALGLAQIVLNHSSLEQGRGEVESLAFVVDMNALFETFVVRSLERALGATLDQWSEQPSYHLDYGNSVLLRPDAVWKRRGIPRLVIDAKWKRTTVGLSADLRQMTLYCTALNCDRGVLIYGEASEPKTHRIRNSQVRIRVESLDLDAEPVEIEARIARLAASLRAFEAADSQAGPSSS